MHRITKDALFLVDGSSLLYRSYYGIRPLTNSRGIPTQAIFGFCRSIKKLIEDFNPQHLIIIWDSKGKTTRSEIYPAYKATRQTPPSDLFLQKDYIIKFADLVGIKQYAKENYEADDLIYSIVKDHSNHAIVLVGPDKDLHQLICKNVVVLDPIKKEVIDAQGFELKHGFKAEKLAFYHALVGDASDNIPGVAGIGDKSATLLVQKFTSLENLYENLDQIESNRIRTQLEKHKTEAFLSLKLFSLQYFHVPVNISQMKFDKKTWDNAHKLFEELEFKGLITSTPNKKTDQHKTEHQTDLFQGQISLGAKSERRWQLNIITNENGLFSLIDHIQKEAFFAFDTETTGTDPMRDTLVGLSIAYNKTQAYYIPVAHKNNTSAEQLPIDIVIKNLRPIFENHKIKKTLHHAKFDEQILLNMGITVNGVVFDTLLAANLLRQESEKINLKLLSLSYLHEKMTSFSEVLGKQFQSFDQVPIADAAEYAAHDALQTFKLTALLQKKLIQEKKLQHIFDVIELPLSKILLAMEHQGILVDPKALSELKLIVDKEIKTIEKKIIATLGHRQIISPETINLNSPKQIEALLFDELKLPSVKKSGKGNRSTDQEVLSELSKLHPIPGLILQHRELYKLKSTYIEALPLAINPNTKRIHTTFSQTMAATGRLSSSNPNLQNIPAGEGLGLQIRAAFIAPKEHLLLSADYSQIELRVLAHMTKDKNLTDAFLHNKDIHRQTAAQIFEVPLEKVSPEQRQTGKRINFSIIYGLTPYGLSRDLNIKPSEAKVYIDKYFAQYPGVAKWIEKTVEQAITDGFVETWWGRRRYVPALHEKNKTLYEAARRIAINSPVQGTSAEIIKLAMINIDKFLEKDALKSKMILQIHDELVLECPEGELKTIEKLVKEEMEAVVKWEIPFVATIRTGKNWAEITK